MDGEKGSPPRVLYPRAWINFDSVTGVREAAPPLRYWLYCIDDQANSQERTQRSTHPHAGLEHQTLLLCFLAGRRNSLPPSGLALVIWGCISTA